MSGVNGEGSFAAGAGGAWPLSMLARFAAGLITGLSAGEGSCGLVGSAGRVGSGGLATGVGSAGSASPVTSM